MSAHGQARMYCTCDAQPYRFLVNGYNTAECQSCGQRQQITPTRRHFGTNTMERHWDDRNTETFNALLGRQEDGG